MLVSIQCLEKHWACLVLGKTMHVLVFGKELAVFQQVVLEKTTCLGNLCFTTKIDSFDSWKNKFVGCGCRFGKVLGLERL